MRRRHLWAILFTWLALALTLLTSGLALADDGHVAALYNKRAAKASSYQVRSDGDPEPETYTVTFYAEDGTTVLRQATCESGTAWADVEKPDDPSKTGYTFAGWQGAPQNITGNVEVTASFVANNYTVTFNANGGTGTMSDQTFTYGVLQNLSANAYTRTGYTFGGWALSKNGAMRYLDGEKVRNLTSEPDATVTLYAVWNVNTFTITWMNDVGALLARSTVNYGEMPVYPRGTPRKADTDQYTYRFTGWTPQIAKATSNATYTAQFEAVVRTYTVTFVDEDGTSVLKEATQYEYGTKASDIVVPDDPTKADDGTYTYSFVGWEPDIADVTKDAVYTATYKAQKLTKAKWKRLAGSNRYGTMAAIVSEGFFTSRVAVLATGENFPDALVASSVAGLYNCPVVLTKSATLSGAASEQLVRMGVKKVYVMGGPGAVSDGVLSTLRKLGITSERIFGSNRQETSIAVLDAVDKGGEFDGTVVIATGYNFADALSIGPWCYKTSTPIMLTNKDGLLSENQIAALKRHVVSKVVIVGGTGAVSDGVLNQIGLDDGAVTRLSGSDRYATSLAIAQWETGEKGMAMTNVAVATGANFPDALAGAALCGEKNSVLLLATDKKQAALKPVNKRSGIETGYVLGGTGAVSTQLFSQLEKLVK